MAKKEAKESKNQDFRMGFNVVKEEADYAWLASARVEHTRHWAPLLFRMALVCNIIASMLYVATVVVVLTKPSPVIYASTERGTIFKLDKVR